MKVVCMVEPCWYHSANGFCTKPIVFLNGNGGCERIYDKRGVLKPNWNTPPEKQEEQKVGRIKEIVDENDE